MAPYSFPVMTADKDGLVALGNAEGILIGNAGILTDNGLVYSTSGKVMTSSPRSAMLTA